MPRSSFPAVFAAFMLAQAALAQYAQAAWRQSEQRTYRVMDYMAQEELGDPVFAPDGQALAFVRNRAPTSQLTNGLLLQETRGEVWLQDAAGKPARNLTSGASDASGWWMPRWSPDGGRLALLSSRGGTVTLWIWERATDQVRQLSPEGVAQYQWLDTRRILFIGLPAGERASPMGEGRGVEQTEAAWSKAKRGELTASVVDSLQFNLPQRRILVLDVGSGAIRSVGTTVGGDAESWWLAPGNRAIAFMQAKPATYGFLDRMKQGYPASIELRLLDSVLSLSRPLPTNVVTTTLHWSPDGQELAFFALGDKAIHRDVMYPNLQYIRTDQWSQGSDIRWPKVDSKEYPGQLWRVNLHNGEVTSWGTGDLDLGQGTEPPEFTWTASGELLFKATRLSDRSRVSAPPAVAWWVLGRDGSLQAGDETQKVISAQEAREEETVQRQAFEKQVKPPAPKAQLVAFSSRGRSGIYQQSGGYRDGDVLWRVSVDRAAEELARVNTFRRAIAGFKEQLVEYTCLNGEKCIAKLTFPRGYQPGRRYPVVVDSDTSYSLEITPHSFKLTYPDEAPSGDAANFAGGGYVYVWATMPTMKGMDETGRANLLNFTGGILPAVEKVVQMGIADPERVFLYGASSMGHGVFGLVTQTSRFKAAVAAVGWVDQASDALSLNMLSRYSDNPFDLQRMGFAKYDHVQLPFWRNGDHLRRNSPLSYVDRVQTPLLILDGDFDYGYMANEEMFFSALVQQRKSARFVRYWGEGHGNQTPVNYRDWYQQTFAWYDQWGDIARDARGNILFDKNGNVRSRGDAPPLTAADYERYEVFGPGGETVKH